MMKKMTKTHWAIYNALKEGAMTQKELCSRVNSILGEKALRFNERATNCKNDERGDHCKPLLKYVREINESPEVDRIIITKKYVYKLGDEVECINYHRYLQEKAFKMYKRASAIWMKIKKNGQGKLVSNQGKEIDEKSKAKRFVDTYGEAD